MNAEPGGSGAVTLPEAGRMRRRLPVRLPRRAPGSRDGGRAGGDAGAGRRVLGGRGPADERDGHEVATRRGSFGVFAGVWVAMMAAMMLPGAVPAVVRRAHVSGRVWAVPLFVGSYLAVWALVGVAVYGLYPAARVLGRRCGRNRGGCLRAHPPERRFRRACREGAGSGLAFGICCVGSGIGLMGCWWCWA